MTIKACIEDTEIGIAVNITNPGLNDLSLGLCILKEWEHHVAFMLHENMEIRNRRGI